MTRPTTIRTRRPASAVVSLVLLCAVATACEPPPPPPPPRPPAPPAPATVPTDLDTFTVSGQPTATRANDVVLRIMDSQGKTKVGYVSFPVARPDTAVLAATLHLTPKQSRFSVQVHNTGSFSPTTNHANRPALGTTVGTGTTTAGARLAIPLRNVRVSGGRVHLAITTTSLYELEIVSREGAATAKAPATAPALGLGATPAPAPTPPPADGGRPGWRLTFADEFNGTSVDTKLWNVYDQAKGDSVESPKATTCPLAGNVTVGGGKLVMRTQKANGACTGGQAQSGAGMNTWSSFRQAGGRFEARGRWTARGNYLWGGFWTHGNTSPGWSKEDPTEIDIWEYIGRDAEPNISRFKPAIHYNYTCGGVCGMQNLPYHGYDVTAWHTYAIEWEPTDPSDPTTMQIRFYLDDVPIALFDRHGTWRIAPDGTRTLEIAGGWKNPKGAFPNPFGLDRPHQLVLSAWVGAPGTSAAAVAAGYRPPGGHADLEIDYVRVYQR